MCADYCVYIWQDESIHSKNISFRSYSNKIQEYKNKNVYVSWQLWLYLVESMMEIRVILEKRCRGRIQSQNIKLKKI